MVLPAFITFDASTATAGVSAERIADRMVIATKVRDLHMQRGACVAFGLH